MDNELSEIYNNLFKNNMDLVKEVVNSMDINSMDYDMDELFQVGYVGLYKAVIVYTGKKNSSVPFEKYAIQYIKKELNKSIIIQNREMSNTISLNDKSLKSVYYTDMNLKRIENEEYRKRVKTVVEAAINSLPKSKHKDMIRLYYGLNGEKRKNYRQIGEIYGCSHEYVQKTISKNLEIIRNKIQGMIDDESLTTEEIVKRVSNTTNNKNAYFEKLANKYSQEEIIKAINMLNNKDKVIVKQYLGIDGYKKLNRSELAFVSGINYHNLDRYIKKCFSNIEKIINGTYEKELEDLVNMYGSEKVDKSISMLDEKERIFMNKYKELNYDLSLLSEYFNTTKGNAHCKVKQIVKNMEYLITGNNRAKVSPYTKIINKYGNIRTTIATQMLENKDKEFIRICMKHKFKMKEVAKEYNLSLGGVHARLTKVLDSLEDIIVNKTTEIDPKKHK